jgi:hypothetical protein
MLVSKRDILDALAQYNTGHPELLRELNKQLTTKATQAADVAMEISGNSVNEVGQLLSNVAFHGPISRAELVDLTLEPVAGD